MSEVDDMPSEEVLEKFRLLRFAKYDPTTEVEIELRAGTVGMGMKACELIRRFPMIILDEATIEAAGVAYIVGAKTLSSVEQRLQGVVVQQFLGAIPPIDSRELYTLDFNLFQLIGLRAFIELFSRSVDEVFVRIGLVNEKDKQLFHVGMELAQNNLDMMLDKLYGALDPSAAEPQNSDEMAKAVAELEEMRRSGGGWVN